MKKTFIATILLLLASFTFSQQQPQWMIALYFETADGQKDTVYYGYDSTASPAPDVIEPQFYELEKFVSSSDSVFNVNIPDYYGFDSVRKASITNDIQDYVVITLFGQFSYPIKMTWENTKLYSNHLPAVFYDIPNRPKARIDLYPNGLCNPGCVDDCYYICTDSLYPDISSFQAWDVNGVFANSVTINCPYNPQHAAPDIMIRIRPFDCPFNWWRNVEKEQNISQDELSIFPNPFNDEVRIKTLNKKDYTYKIISTEGRVLKTGKIKHEIEKINLQAIDSKILLIKILDNNKKIICTRKLVKED